MIKFILNNQFIETTENQGISLLDFIRNQGLKGTKAACREGDCGACTVLIGTLQSNTVTYRSVASCMTPLGNIQGKHVVTIEGLSLKNELNFVQKAIAENFATQCGFCTPGFVVSFNSFALQKGINNLGTIKDAISGNICRCTGYKAIEKASDEINQKLQAKDLDKPIEWLINENFIPEYFKEIANRLKEIQQPENQQTKSSKIIAGGTDLMVHSANELAENKELNFITQNPDFKGISFDNTFCTLGAATSISEIIQNTKLQTFFPQLNSFMKLISSQQIRNIGTIGGNFVNASPIGDMSVFFLALNSLLIIENQAQKTRELSLKNFFLDYKKTDLKENEIIRSIKFKIPQTQSYFNFEKVSKRTHLDIASVNTACYLTINQEKITDIHISIGGVAAIPYYLEKTSKFLKNKEINTQNIKKAEEILQTEITPISDIRGSADYKRELAKNLFYSHFIKLFPTKITFENLVLEKNEKY